jgi:hypothetical protein
MPYSIETNDGIVIDNVPDHIPRDADVLRQRVQQARAQRQQETRAQSLRDTAEGLSPWEWGMANVGAGMSNLGLGARQLGAKIGIGSGPTDDEIREKREMDEALAGEGWRGKGLQILGETLPTLAVPAGIYAAPLRAARVGPVTALLGTGAAGGAAGAALAPVTSDESRGGNMVLAAGLGAAVPGAGTALSKGAKAGYKVLTQAGARQRALEGLAEYLPEARRANVAQRLSDYRPPSIKGQQVDLPTSGAQATGDAGLAQAEAASRSRPTTGPAWQDFDASRNAGLYGALQDLAPSDLRLDRLTRARDLAAGPLRERALADAGQRGGFADPVLRHADDLLTGDTGANTGVQTIAKYVQNVIGPDATPGRLYEARKFLASKLSGPSAVGDEMAAAAKGAQRETRALIQSIDDALDDASKGQWSPYLTEYGRRSQPINSGAALRKVADKIADKPLRGDTPEMTAAGLGQAVRQYGTGKYGDRFTPEAGQDVAGLLQTLKRGESAARSRKLSATMGGGSITNSDQLLGAFTDKVLSAIPGVGGYVGRLRNFNMEAVEAEMARLLQDPGALGAALRDLPASQRQRLIAAAYDTAQTVAGQGAAQGMTP